ncbi:MAG TPA: hypothetical protein VEH06_05750 [Candidatus Bathyarchaeia archaeon]|nr:hypothetical protein [Candidatus Bathyarchaeia archaeon]
MKSIKEHVGFVVGDGHSMNAAAAIKKIVAAEAAGIRQVDESSISRYNHDICSCVDSLVMSGNEDTVTARFLELLASGSDELMVTLLSIVDTGDEQQHSDLCIRLVNSEITYSPTVKASHS